MKEDELNHVLWLPVNLARWLGWPQGAVIGDWVVMWQPREWT